MAKLNVVPDPYGHRLTSANDVNLRYNDSVIMYRGTPHLLEYQPGGSRWEDILAYPYDVDNDKFLKSFKINIVADKDVSLDFDLGWVAGGSEKNDIFHVPRAFYVERIPTRKYKQGLCSSNVIVQYPSLDINGRFSMRGSPCNTVTISIAMSNNIPTKYMMRGLTTKERIDVLMEYILRVSKSPSLDEGDANNLLMGISTALNKRVALINCSSSGKKYKIKNVKDVRFKILIDKEIVGELNPHIMDIELKHDGLFSIIQDDLISAGLTS